MISRGIPSKYYPQWGCFEKDQAEALAAIGHKVIVMSVDARFARHRGHMGLHHKIENGVEYYNYVTIPQIIFSKCIGYDNYINYIKTSLYKKLLKKIIDDQGKPDVIYTQFFANTVMGIKLKETLNIPVIGIEHLARFNESVLSESDYKWASYAFKGADAMIAVSESLAGNIHKKFGINTNVIPNILGPEFLNARLLEIETPGPFVFVAVGSLVQRKGFDTLINAFSKANLKEKNCYLNIIGEGEERKNLQSLIDKLNLAERIKILGNKTKNQIVDYLQRSNVFVLPSRNETFGVVYIEALSLGLPNIATICGGPETFINKSNGLLVKPDDEEGLANAMIEIYNNYNVYNRNQIRIECLSKFSPEIVGKQLTHIFQNVINNFEQ